MRTPLAALRLELEAQQLTATEPAAIGRALTEVDRLAQTIDTLLAVARDHPRSAAACELVGCSPRSSSAGAAGSSPTHAR